MDKRVMIPVSSLGGRLIAKVVTPKAILINITGDQFVWMPFSQVYFISNINGRFAVMTPWFAKQIGYSKLGHWTSDQEVADYVAGRSTAYTPIFKDDGITVDDENVFIQR